VNFRAFSAVLQDRREVQTLPALQAARTMAEGLIWPFSLAFPTHSSRRLRARGYQVDYQVGVSGFRIDLGVRHPDKPDMFLAGIECDGAQYHSSKSGRDRDRLREKVLRGLGWNILRVWSADWFENSRRDEEARPFKLSRRSGWNRPFR
jgi:very-short-patch-repair endonuclease